MFDLWKEPLTEEERDQLLDKAALEIKKRKLELPAVMALEMHKPLANLGAHAMVAFSPFLAPFVGFDNVNNYSRLMSDRDNFERLILRLEKRDDLALNEEARC